METLLMIVTLVSLGLAVLMSVVGWRLLGGDRRRSAARVETLESEALEAEAFSTDEQEWDLPRPLVADLDLAPSIAPNRRALIMAAAAVLIVAGAVTVLAVRRPGTGDERTRGAASIAGPAKPLELLSLRHAADPGGSFSVTGLVQNPADGKPLTGVVAVIYLFDRDGNYFASGRSTLDVSSLRPGDESPFVVHIPAAAGVARYRVTFRKDDGGVMPHVDRRTSEMSEGRRGKPETAGGAGE